MNYRTRFNENVKKLGNKVHDGLGDTLTMKVNSKKIGAYATIAVMTATTAQAGSYIDNIVDKLHQFDGAYKQHLGEINDYQTELEEEIRVLTDGAKRDQKIDELEGIKRYESFVEEMKEKNFWAYVRGMAGRTPQEELEKYEQLSGFLLKELEKHPLGPNIYDELFKSIKRIKGEYKPE